MKIKKNIVLTAIFILFFSSILLAKYCINCGASISDTDNFCPICGYKQPSLIKLPNKESNNSHNTGNLKKTTNINTRKIKTITKDKIIKLFSATDRFEKNIKSMKFLNVIGNYPDYKIRFKRAVSIFTRIKPKLDIPLKLLGEAYIRKSHAFNTIIKVMRSFGLGFGLKDSILKSASIEIKLYNDFINKIKNSISITPNETKKLLIEFENIKNKMKLYQVTSSYLRINKSKMPKGSKFIVISVNGKKARLLFIGENRKGDMVEGDVNLRSLTKRTTWEKTYTKFYK